MEKDINNNLDVVKEPKASADSEVKQELTKESVGEDSSKIVSDSEVKEIPKQEEQKNTSSPETPNKKLDKKSEAATFAFNEVAISTTNLVATPYRLSDAEKVKTYDIVASNQNQQRSYDQNSAYNPLSSTNSGVRTELVIHDKYGKQNFYQESVLADFFKLKGYDKIQAIENIPQDTWLGYEDQDKIIPEKRPDKIQEILGDNPFSFQKGDGNKAIIPDPTIVKIPIGIKLDPGFSNVAPVLNDGIKVWDAPILNRYGLIGSNYVNNSGIKSVALRGNDAVIQVLNSTTVTVQNKKTKDTVLDDFGNPVPLANFSTTLNPFDSNALYSSTDSRDIAYAGLSYGKITFDDIVSGSDKINSSKVKSLSELDQLIETSSASEMAEWGKIFNIQQAEDRNGLPNAQRVLMIDDKGMNDHRVWYHQNIVDKELFAHEKEWSKIYSNFVNIFNERKAAHRFGDGSGLDAINATVLQTATSYRMLDNTYILANLILAISSMYNEVISTPKVSKLSRTYQVLSNARLLNKVKQLLMAFINDTNYLVWKDPIEKILAACEIHKLKDSTVFDKRNPLIAKIIGLYANCDIQDKTYEYSQLIVPTPTAMRDSISNVLLDYGLVSSNLLRGEPVYSYKTISSTSAVIQVDNPYSKGKGRKLPKRVFDIMGTILRGSTGRLANSALQNFLGSDVMNESTAYDAIKEEIKGLTNNKLETSLTISTSNGNYERVNAIYNTQHLSDFSFTFIHQISGLKSWYDNLFKVRKDFKSVVDVLGLEVMTNAAGDKVVNASTIIEGLLTKLNYLIDRYNPDNYENWRAKGIVLSDVKSELESKAIPWNSTQLNSALQNFWSTLPYPTMLQNVSFFGSLSNNLESLKLFNNSIKSSLAVLLNTNLSRSHLGMDYADVTASTNMNWFQRHSAPGAKFRSYKYLDLLQSTRTGKSYFKAINNGAIITRRLLNIKDNNTVERKDIQLSGLTFSTRAGSGLDYSTLFQGYVLIQPTSSLVPFIPEFYSREKNQWSIPLSSIAEGFSTYDTMVSDYKLLDSFEIGYDPDDNASIISAYDRLLYYVPINFEFTQRSITTLGLGAYADKFKNWNFYGLGEASVYLQLKDLRELILQKNLPYHSYIYTPAELLYRMTSIDLSKAQNNQTMTFTVIHKTNKFVDSMRDKFEGIHLNFSLNTPTALNFDIDNDYKDQKHLATYRFEDIAKVIDTPSDFVAEIENVDESFSHNFMKNLPM